MGHTILATHVQCRHDAIKMSIAILGRASLEEIFLGERAKQLSSLLKI